MSIGTAEQAIAFALEIDDHFDMRAFLREWQDGSIANDDGDEWGYAKWLARNKSEFQEAV